MRYAVYALVCLGGIAALSWEVLWQLEISIAVGISALGTAITLAALMGGMTSGSLLGARWIRQGRIASPLRAYGVLELVIGVSGLLLDPAFSALEVVDARVYRLAPAAAPLVHLVGLVAILAAPTLAMGASLPLFKLIGRAHGTSIGFLYGANTFGAAVGVLAAAFVLLPVLGVDGTALLVAGLNGLVFAGATWMAGNRRVRVDDDDHAPGAAALPLRVAVVLASVTGAATFALEVAWFRALRAAFWSTTASFAAMLFAVLVSLAVAARLAPFLERRLRREGVLLVVAGALILLATPVIERLDLVVGPWGARGTTAHRVLACVLVMGPPITVLGALLPWLLDQQGSARRCGYVYAANTLGAIGGSLGAAWVLLPWLGVVRTSWLVGAVVALAGMTLLERRARLRFGVLAAAALGFAVWSASGVGTARVIGANFYGPHRVLESHEGPDVTTSVIEVFGDKRGLLIDGFAAAGEWSATAYMEWMGRLPMLLHDDPQDALVICFGTGQTANAVRREGAARLRIVDVNPAVYRTAHHFTSNEGVLADPRVTTVVMDGRAWLRRTTERYDVVTLEPMPPNHVGVNSLYSREFYELVKSRLRDGGVTAQWLPAHLVTEAHARAIAATFLAVFPDAILWVHPGDDNGVLLGRKWPDDVPRDVRWPGLAREAGPRPLADGSIAAAVLLPPDGLARYARGATLVTDDNQHLAYGAILDLRTRGPRGLDVVRGEFLGARGP